MLFYLKSYFSSMDISVPTGLVQTTMMKACGFLWVLLCDIVLSLSRHLYKHLARSRLDDDHVGIFDTAVVLNEEEDRIVRSSSDSNFDGFGEEETSEFTFGFQFQMKDVDLMSFKDAPEAKSRDTGDVFMEDGLTATTTAMATSTSKYQFVPVHDFGGFVAEPEPVSFTVHEMFLEEGSNSNSKVDDSIIKERRISQNILIDLVEVQQDAEIEDEKKALNENSNLQSNGKVDDFMETEVSACQMADISDTDSINSVEKSQEPVNGAENCNQVQELQEEKQSNLGENGVLKLEQNNWLGEFFMRNDSFSLGVEFSQEDENENDSFDPPHQPDSDDSGDGYFSISPQDVGSVEEQVLETLIPPVSKDMNDDYIELKPHIKDHEKELQNSDSNSIHESDSFLGKMESENEIDFEEEDKINSWDFDSDEEEDEADLLLEHQELIDQMKMELKNARTGGLPTILEESETPRMKEDLKPLKIDEKLEHRDQMAEIQKFYRSYTEKMRKLDVLNYQTLQAINFLRMKHPEQLNTEENTSLSAIKSVLLPSLWPCKLRRIYADPTLKSITELHKDLEIVYVGHACLSWEVLHWQYKKAKELQLYDPQGYRSYNQVAIEFQQFHVLLRRFTEDELFQGPRVLNYAKQRCILRGLLQVPAIRDDNLKEKKARMEDEGDAVSISTMAKMIKESMMVFWDFLHTDKDTTNLFLTIILQGSKAHLQDPTDSDLFMDVKTCHQKKEKRLKDMLRTGNCIVKKFQKQQETILDQHMFVSQVELKLVSRVLSLPRLSRDQMIWCQSKLNNIKFIDRKIQVEDSLFLLFPC